MILKNVPLIGQTFHNKLMELKHDPRVPITEKIMLKIHKKVFIEKNYEDSFKGGIYIDVHYIINQKIMLDISSGISQNELTCNYTLTGNSERIKFFDLCSTRMCYDLYELLKIIHEYNFDIV